MRKENAQTSDTSDLTSTPKTQDIAPICEVNAEPSQSVTPNATIAAAPPSEVVAQCQEPQPVNLDRKSRVYALQDSYRGIGADLCSGYGSLSRVSLHSYWSANSFQPGAHHTLPFLRDSHSPAGLSAQTEGDRLTERAETPLDMKADHPAASYPTLGGIHQFRPITTMELLREPSRTR